MVKGGKIILFTYFSIINFNQFLLYEYVESILLHVDSVDNQMTGT